MASVMGLGGTALDKIRNRGTTAQAIEPVDAQIVQKNRIKPPTAERIPLARSKQSNQLATREDRHY